MLMFPIFVLMCNSDRAQLPLILTKLMRNILVKTLSGSSLNGSTRCDEANILKNVCLSHTSFASLLISFHSLSRVSCISRADEAPPERHFQFSTIQSHKQNCMNHSKQYQWHDERHMEGLSTRVTWLAAVPPCRRELLSGNKTGCGKTFCEAPQSRQF